MTRSVIAYDLISDHSLAANLHDVSLLLQSTRSSFKFGKGFWMESPLKLPLGSFIPSAVFFLWSNRSSLLKSSYAWTKSGNDVVIRKLNSQGADDQTNYLGSEHTTIWGQDDPRYPSQNLLRTPRDKIFLFLIRLSYLCLQPKSTVKKTEKTMKKIVLASVLLIFL